MPDLYKHDIDYDGLLVSIRLCGWCLQMQKVYAHTPYIGDAPRTCQLCTGRIRSVISEWFRNNTEKAGSGGGGYDA